MSKTNVQTVRRNDMTDLDRGVAVLGLEAEDPLGRLGNRKMKEKLGLKTKHLTRYAFVHLFSQMILSLMHW